jgi:hypothetical protein
VSVDTAYGISKDDGDYKIHKINLGSTRNSWTSSSFDLSTSGFSSIDINMGQFALTASTPYLYYVGKLKNYLGSSVSDYSKHAGFLMKMMAVPGTYSDETCGKYTITNPFNTDSISSYNDITKSVDNIVIKTSTGSFSMKSSSETFTSSL